MVLFDAPYQHVEFYTAQNLIISQWYGHCTSQEYRDALNRFNYFVTRMGVQYAIADRRLLPPLSLADAEWTLGEFLDSFRKLPLKRFAIINAFDERAGEQLDNFIHNDKLPLPFETQVFQDLTSAYDWVTGIRETL